MENFLTAAKLHTHAKRFMDAYSAAMQPLSREFAIPQTAAEILLFLANNPENSTAKESVAIILTINWINIVLQNTSYYKIIDRHDGSDTCRNTKSGENRINHVDRAGEIIAVKEIAD